MSDLEWFLFGAVIVGGSMGVGLMFWLDRLLKKYRLVPRQPSDARPNRPNTGA